MRTTDLGYPTLGDEIHERVFGNKEREKISQKSLNTIKANLQRHGISVPISSEVNYYEGELPLPQLRGNNLAEHFENIAKEQIGHYLERAEMLSRCDIPPFPPMECIRYSPGWTKYTLSSDKWEVEAVPFPEETGFCFDTETFVFGGNFPIIGTALSDKSYYLWLASELLDPELPEKGWDQFRMIPVGKNRFIFGHNIAFDRIRSQEAYTLEGNGPENFFFDTLSAHVGVSGLASGQRWIHALDGKDFDLLTEKEKKILRRKPKWFFRGSTNSLVACYNYHVAAQGGFFGDKEPLDEGAKEVREIFVKAESLQEIKDCLEDCIEYALKDVKYTFELFQALWSKYRNSTPSDVAMCGHYHLSGSIIPLASNWGDWVDNVETVYQNHIEEMTKICKDLMWDLLESWKEGEEEKKSEIESDPWYSQLDWEVKTTRGKYAGIPTWARDYIKDPDKEIGVRSRLAHLLLRLNWEGSPIRWIPGEGWCWGQDPLSKVPHPKGTGENVGGLLTKDFVKDLRVGRLSSSLPEAKRALKVSDAISYWTSVRKRVMSRIPLRVNNPLGEDCLITLPEILPHGTYSRRTVENLMITMCSTKNWRIGTELKTRVTAPEGWKVVGADFDGQEMQIASIYADKWEGGFVGCSPLGNMVLCGSKENGTDPHTTLARRIRPDIYEGLVWDPELGPCEEVT
jgi:DNA polymerase gamma 1